MELRLAQFGLQAIRRLLGGATQVGAEAASKELVEKAAKDAATGYARDQLVKRGESVMRGKVLRTAPKQAGIEGGYLAKEIKVDELGQRWLAKTFWQDLEYRAIGDKVGADVVRALGVETPAIHLRQATIGGKRQLATVQKMVSHSGVRLPLDPHQLTKAQVDQLTASQVARWLIGDHDGKVANYLVKEGGEIVTIDLGNMYRHFPDDVLSKSWVANREEPIHNRIWQAFTEGTLAVDFLPGLEMVARIEALPDEKFLALIKPYVDARYQAAQEIPAGLPTAADFMRAALERKRHIRADVTAFYDQMLLDRKGKGFVAKLKELVGL